MASQDQPSILSDADFAGAAAPAPQTLTDADFAEKPSVSAPPTPQATTFLEDKNTVVGHSADLSHDQVNDAIQTSVYGRPRTDWHQDALPLSAEALSALKNEVSSLPFASAFTMGQATTPADLATTAKESGKAVVRDLESVPIGVAGLLKWAGEGLSDQDKVALAAKAGRGLADIGQTAIDFYRQRQESGFEAPDPEVFRGSYLSNPSFARLAANVTGSLPQLAGASALTLATGNPVLGAASLGLMNAGEQYDVSRREGESYLKSSAVAAVTGIGNALLMSIPIGHWFESTGSLGARVASNAASFAAVTPPMVAFNNVMARIGGDRTRRISEGMAESILAGAVSGGVLGAFTPGRGAEIDSIIQEMHKDGVPAKDIDGMRSEIATQMAENPDAISGVIAQFDRRGIPVRQPADVVSTVEAPNGEQVPITHQMILDEAQGLLDQAQVGRGPSELEQFAMRNPIRAFQPDETGRVPEAEEHRGVPVRFKSSYGQPADELAQEAYDHGLIDEPSADAYREALKNIPTRGPAPRLADFYDQAQHELEGFYSGQLSAAEARAAYGTPRSTFYSAVDRAITDKMPPKASPDQVKGLLSNTPGVKQEEIDWLGLDAFLKGKKSVTKEDLQSFVRANNVQIQEVMKGSVPTEHVTAATEAAAVLKRYDMLGFDSVNQALAAVRDNPDYLERWDLKDITPRERAVLDNWREKSQQTKFEKYTLPGGENYRELLLTLPSSARPISDLDRQRIEQLRDLERRGALTTAERSELNETGRQDVFRSGHFSEPNILAHVRFNDRTDAQGNRVLFLEEVQSDWHQKGRSEGYREQTPAPLRFEDGTFGQDQHQWFVTMPDGTRYAVGKGVVDGRIEAEDYLKRVIQTRESEIAAKAARGVPDAPFKKTWPELAMKRMLRYAAENGYDKIAWTTGEQQAERYDLSKQLSEISYSGTNLKAFDKNGGEVISRTGVTPTELPDIIGKEAAKKLMKQEPKGTLRTLSGLDLKVGGEGMKGFYDQMLPSFMNKYAKKWGGRVEPLPLGMGNDLNVAGDYSGPTFSADSLSEFLGKNQDVLGARGVEQLRAVIIAMRNGESFRSAIEQNGSQFLAQQLGGEISDLPQRVEQVHSLDVTPSMKESVMQGQPLFEPTKPYSEQPYSRSAAFESHLRPNEDLTGASKEVESKTSNYIRRNTDSIIQRYDDKFGKYISVDEMKTLLPEYSGTNAHETHEPASAITKVARDEAIARAVREGKTDFIVSGGGPGSGKSTLIEGQIDSGEIGDEVGAVIDNTMSNLANTEKLIDSLRAKGRVSLKYVYRDPIEAWKGVLERVGDTGRVIPLNEFIAKSRNAYENIFKLADHYGDKVKIDAYESLPGKVFEPITLDELKNKGYNVEDVKGELANEIEKRIQVGEISGGQARSLLGRSDQGEELHSGGGAQNPPDVRAQESETSPYQQELNLEGEKDLQAPEGTPPSSQPTVRGGFKALQNPHLEVEFKEVGSVIIPNRKIQEPADLAYAFKELKNEAQENFFLVAVKDKRVAGVEHLGFGTINQVAVYPFETISLIDKANADSFYLVHNHPSGSIEASPEDKTLTKVISRALQRNGAEFLGHVIIDDGKFGFIHPDLTETTGIQKEYLRTKKVAVLRKYFDWKKSKSDAGPSLTSARSVFELSKGIQQDPDNGVLYLLDNQNRVTNAVIVPHGKFDAGTIQKLAAAYRSNAVIMVNSGQVDLPGLRSALKDVDIRLLDDVKLSGDSYLSANEQGYLETPAKYGTAPAAGEPAASYPGERLADRYDRLKKEAADRGMGAYEANRWAKTQIAKEGFSQGEFVRFRPFDIRMLESDKTTGRDIREQYSGIKNEQIVRGNQLSDQIKRMVPSKVEREGMFWYKAARGDVDKIAEALHNEKFAPYEAGLKAALNLSPAASKALTMASQYYDEAGAISREIGTISNVRDEYQNRIYAPEKETDFVKTETKSGIKQTTRHAKQRVYDTEFDAVEGGKTFATTDMADALSIHNEEMARVNASRRLADAMSAAKLGAWKKDVPDGWQKVGVLEKAVPVRDKNNEPVLGEDGNQLVSHSNFVAPKGIADALKAIADPNFTKKIDSLRNIQRFQGLVKTWNLSWSLFHHMALTMQAVYQGGIGTVLRYPVMEKVLASPDFGANERDFAAHTGITSKVEANQDILRNLTENRGDFFSKIVNLPGVKQSLKSTDRNAEFLFGHIQRYLKVTDYATKVSSWLGDHPDATDAQIRKAKIGYAREVNAVYGGLNWEALGMTKANLFLMRLVLLAPDWTSSNALMLKYALGGGTEGSAARGYIARSLLIGITATEGLNKLMTGHFTDENKKGHQLEVEIAPDVYVSILRGAFQDINKFSSNIIESGLPGATRFLEGKLAPFARTAAGALNNVEYTGHPIVKRGEGPAQGTYDLLKYLIGSAGPVPFGLSNYLQYLESERQKSALGTIGIMTGLGRYSRSGRNSSNFKM